MADTDNGKIIENTAKNEMENNMIQTYENSKDILPTVQVEMKMDDTVNVDIEGDTGAVDSEQETSPPEAPELAGSDKSSVITKTQAQVGVKQNQEKVNVDHNSECEETVDEYEEEIEENGVINTIIIKRFMKVKRQSHSETEGGSKEFVKEAAEPDKHLTNEQKTTSVNGVEIKESEVDDGNIEVFKQEEIEEDSDENKKIIVSKMEDERDNVEEEEPQESKLNEKWEVQTSLESAGVVKHTGTVVETQSLVGKEEIKEHIDEEEKTEEQEEVDDLEEEEEPQEGNENEKLVDQRSLESIGAVKSNEMVIEAQSSDGIEEIEEGFDEKNKTIVSKDEEGEDLVERNMSKEKEKWEDKKNVESSRESSDQEKEKDGDETFEWEGEAKDDEEGEESEALQDDNIISTKSLSSGHQQQDDNNEMTQRYEVLSKLRSEQLLLKRKHILLNSKLVQYFKKQKMEHVFAEIKEDPSLEQQYLKKLALFHETNQLMNEEKLKINTALEAQRISNKTLLEKVETGWKELLARKKEIASKLVNSKTGRTAPYDKVIDDLLERQEKQRQLISECRLVQIKLKHRIDEKKMERQMPHKGQEFDIMDYEKLASLKEYYMDKVTERDIEIAEVSEKIARLDETLVQVKEHLKKKEAEMAKQRECLKRATQELYTKRANLSSLKVARHHIERQTAKIKQKSGLLAYPLLLQDYEQKTKLVQQLRTEVEMMKQAHTDAVTKIRKLRESSRSVQSNSMPS